LDEKREYSEKSEEELLADLADLLYGGDTQEFGPSDARRRIEDARAWADRWLSRNRESLCREFDRRGLLSAAAMERLTDGSVVLDVILTFGLGLPGAAIVSALIVKWGLRKMCTGAPSTV